ncbi:DUF4279 domain-containing protein [Acaryochloris marina]|uniref:DUF4279 domain-containing protein n=1 Tax=Acaryochloris marina (strain MBIC 11017) TaxID=329726 RepID=B0C1A4_ACAM1|nr:DUF4279 domain-containing protein [Acaryochloris marina]ABW28502.1 hypothetical protein AM1_3512 [Acaryochloris marina MBIC11017]BDM77504.1 hypothetical protein AM10699_03780 [Acaryochloris marina MBIC10699]
MEYNDDYAICEKTYATLRLYPGTKDPHAVTKLLGIQPTFTQRLGDPLSSRRQARINGWFLKTEHLIDSLDSRRHIDWLLDQVEPITDRFFALRQAGCKADISCFWQSLSGHGGPTISPQQSRRLAELNLELWFDVYLGGSEEVDNATPFKIVG